MVFPVDILMKIMSIYRKIQKMDSEVLLYSQVNILLTSRKRVEEMT
jgi:hypothetical protein